MGKHTVRIIKGIIGAIDNEMDQHAGGNGGRNKMERLHKEKRRYQQELEKRDHRDKGRIQ